MSYQQNRNLWAELPQETSGISDAAEPPLEAVADFGHVQRSWVHQSQWLKMAEVWIAVVTWWTSALPVVISHWILMKNITGHMTWICRKSWHWWHWWHCISGRTVPKKVLWCAMVHVPPTQGTQGTWPRDPRGYKVQLLSHPWRFQGKGDVACNMD